MYWCLIAFQVQEFLGASHSNTTEGRCLICDQFQKLVNNAYSTKFELFKIWISKQVGNFAWTVCKHFGEL